LEAKERLSQYQAEHTNLVKKTAQISQSHK